MKYIKLFEKYSQPDNVIEKLTSTIFDFILNKFHWWWTRKGLANYSETHVIDIPIENIDDKFPVKTINLSTKFVVSSKFSKWSAVSGGYAEDPQINEDETVTISLGIDIYVPKLKNSYNEDGLREEIEDAIMHELLHCYQHYKKGAPINVSKLTNTIVTFIEILNTEKFNLFQDFINICYIASSQDEAGAYLTQLYAKSGHGWVTGNKKIIRGEKRKSRGLVQIRNMKYDEMLKIIRTELKPDDIQENLEVWNIISKRNGLNKIFETFEDLFHFLYYKVYLPKADYLFKKAIKINPNILDKVERKF